MNTRFPREHGAIFFELAMVAPLILLLSAGAVEFGSYYYSEQRAQLAVTEIGRAVLNRCMFPGSKTEECLNSVIREDLSRYVEENFPDFKKKGALYIAVYSQGAGKTLKLDCQTSFGDCPSCRTGPRNKFVEQLEAVVQSYSPVLVTQIDYLYTPIFPAGSIFRFLNSDHFKQVGVN